MGEIHALAAALAEPPPDEVPTRTEALYAGRVPHGCPVTRTDATGEQLAMQGDEEASSVLSVLSVVNSPEVSRDSTE